MNDAAQDNGAGDRPSLVRIGEMGRRLNATPEVLRAWERRYGLFEPQRSPGGFRLYTALDQRRGQAMISRIASGVAPAEAARQVITSLPVDGGDESAAATDLFAAFRQRLEAMDGQGAGQMFEDLSRAMGVDSLICHLVMPIMRDFGELWELGSVTIAQEHFASGFFRRRLMALADNWENGERRALLACGPEEQHDLPLICLGLGLHHHGWGVTYLGTRTPAESLLEAADRGTPDVIVVSCTVEDGLDAGLQAIATSPPAAPVYLVGRAAGEERAARIGSHRVPSVDPIAVARWIHESTLNASD